MKCTIYAIVVLASLCLRQMFSSAPHAGGAQVNCHLCESACGLPMRHMVNNLLQLNQAQGSTHAHSVAMWGRIKCIFYIGS